MTKAKTTLTTVLLILLAVLLAKQIGQNQQNNPQQLEGIHPLFAFDDELFYKGINSAKIPKDTYIAGGIVPHDMLASFMISDFFYRLVEQKPKVIIIIGPNHSENGGSLVQSSNFGWATPLGVVEPHVELIQELVDLNIVKINEQVLANEHSIGTLAPFIKYYLPDSKIVPLILSRKMNLTDIQKVSDKLSELESIYNSVIVASVDFSHYLLSDAAEMNDSIALEAMRQFNYPQIQSFNSDYTDSPASIIALFKIMSEQGLRSFEVLQHTNSAHILNNYTVQTTSYYSLIFSH